MRSRTTVLSGGGTATGIEIPAEVVESFRAGKRPPVRVTINGSSDRNPVTVTGTGTGTGGVDMIGISSAAQGAT